MKVSRLELATKYLIDPIRAYGHRPITVRVNMDGESVEIMANVTGWPSDALKYNSEIGSSNY